MSGFLDTVEKARVLLAERRHVSIRGLRREFSLDDETLDDLVEELVEGSRVARRDGGRLVWCGAGESAARGQQRPTTGETGERRHLTVMFCDLVGSTELSQRLDPEELRGVMYEYRSICVEATQHFGGHVAQYMGDGVLVYFGYPHAWEDQADRALRSALELLRIMGEHRLAARVGIHSGLVVVDPDGVGDDALALGPTTNLAARFQGIAKTGTVVVSEETLALCRSLFITKSLGETQVKGVEHPVVLHEVQRVVGIRSAVESESRSPMLGRDSELERICKCWEEVQGGRGQAVLITGEAGMGKSRLVRAFRETLADTPHLPLVVQCSPYASSSAFQPIVEQLQTRLGLQDADSPEAGREQVVQGLERLPGLPSERVIPYLLPLLSLPASERYPLPQTSADEQRERTLAAILQLTATLSEREPLVMVVEDLHWSDPSTLEFLGRLVEQSECLRVMLVATSRPEFHMPWSGANVSSFELSRLSKQATRELVASLVEAGRLDSLVDEIERRSDGVPLFVEELTAGIISSEADAAAESDGEARSSAISVSIPASLQDALMARLDRLGPSKRIAQQGATLGHEFPRALIEAISELDSDTLDHALDQLVEAQILHRSGAGRDEFYTFHHALLQDTAYESQLLSTRKTLHAEIVRALEEGFPKRVETEPDLMAHHCAAASLHDDASAHYVRAAELAISRIANEEAAEHLRRALDALSRLPESDERNQREIGIRVPHGQALAALRGRDAPEVLSTYARLEELCDAVGEGPQQIPALIGLMTFDALQRVDPALARERGEVLLRIVEPLGISQLLVVAHAIIAGNTMANGSPLEAAERLELAIEIGQSCEFPAPATPNDPDILALAHGMYVHSLAGGGKTEQMADAMGPMYERIRAIDHDLSLVSALANVAGAGYHLLDPELCRSGAAEALAVAEGRGFYTNEAVILVLHGWARAHQGEIDAGIEDVERGLAVEAASGPPLSGGYYLIAAADVYRLAKNWKRAEELLERASEVADFLAVSTASLGYVRGLFNLEFGDERLEEAENNFLAAHAKAIEVDMRWGAVCYATQLAHIAPRTGKVREAYDRLVRAYAGLAEGHERRPARDAQAAIDELASLLDT